MKDLDITHWIKKYFMKSSLEILIQWIKDNPFEKRLNILRKAIEINDHDILTNSVNNNDHLDSMGQRDRQDDE